MPSGGRLARYVRRGAGAAEASLHDEDVGVQLAHHVADQCLVLVREALESGGIGDHGTPRRMAAAWGWRQRRRAAVGCMVVDPIVVILVLAPIFRFG